MHDGTALPTPVADASLVHRFPERYLAIAILAIFLTVTTSSFGGFVVLGAIPFAWLLREGAFPRFARHSARLAFVGVPAVVLRSLSTNGTPVIHVAGIAVTLEGMTAGATIALRIAVAALWGFFLAAALRSRELEMALGRIGVPPSLLELVGLTRSFSRQLGSTLSSAWAAAALRGGLSSTAAFRRTAGLLGGVVLTRALDRADRVATARALRGHGVDTP